MFGSIEVSDTDIELMTNENLAKGDNVNLTAHEVRLKYFAQGIAKLLNDPEIGVYLKQEIGKQFDGDYDALWETLAEKDFVGKGKFKNILRKLYISNVDMVDKFSSVTLLQISLPINFDMWDGSEPILVAYDPITIDDDECKQITAYDMEGKEYILDAKNEPDYTVIVVGLNERIDPTTKYPIMDNAKATGKITGTSWNLHMREMYLYNDMEPWYKGKPEIYFLLANANTLDNRYNFYNSWPATNNTGY